MERVIEQTVDELVDLGQASLETKGPGVGGQDAIGLRNPAEGINDD